jgi:predicted MFS family arabinose efflux permease
VDHGRIKQAAGLLILWSSTTPDMALAGAALRGCGFALVFPALGVKAVKTVADQNHGAALGVYTAFLDLAMAITGPVAGFIVGRFGYSEIFLYGAGSASATLVLTLLLYQLARERLANVAGDARPIESVSRRTRLHCSNAWACALPAGWPSTSRRSVG